MLWPMSPSVRSAVGAVVLAASSWEIGVADEFVPPAPLNSREASDDSVPISPMSPPMTLPAPVVTPPPFDGDL